MGLTLKINIFMNNLNVIMCERLLGLAALSRDLYTVEKNKAENSVEIFALQLIW